ncbi:inositol polyphosphate 5-phosphatase E isoform X2 [Nylanderia fulva]|uniref:inositol polyphosphate 5-phosphatase E isoform X2 n=1 Tax=Nylanderia fulva TaxID=613905 RepID=UPI0010FB86F7|nr:inositol polyphosphate 5-phosphatase E isoform X2 [Nylanderia fulva]
MEQSDGNDISSVSNIAKVNVSPKSKQKKKSLCRMLMNKKTKVGCLEPLYKDGDSNKNSKIENSQHGSQTSTKLSLCCAMTERSRTPPQSLTVSRLSPTLSRTSVKSEVASINNSNDHQTEVLVEKEEMHGANDQPEMAQETVVKRNNVAARKEQRYSSYIEGENSSSGSLSPSISGQLRRRLLHRRSADNLIVSSPTNSMRHSSPESIRSVPIQHKPRSTSHDALSKKKERYFFQTGASMDSLAKQSLLAAQVLNLIPTHKARERNFLHGRIAANSLLGPVELEKVLPNRELKIFIGTWNMNGQTPPKELNDFMLPSDIETVPDLLAIGTQESCSERNEWEAALQETLGPSHVLLTSSNLGTLHLAIFLRRDLIWFCSIPEEDSFSTRPGTAFRTKGAVAIALMIFGTSFLFVTAHLTAHQDKVKERVNDIKRIVRNLDLPKELPTRHKSKDVTQNFDCVFWCGDLNFRLAQPREEVIQWITNTCFPQESINLHKDQLKTILNEGAVLRGFEEAAITFPPTYKYDPGTQNFDSSNKQRTPAYTDRILFKGKGHTRGYIRRVSHEITSSHKDGAIECLVYDSVPSICTSDHKPVWGVFKTTLRPGIDTIPLGAGLFNREIYLEGIRRRAAAMDDSLGTSKVCSVQ